MRPPRILKEATRYKRRQVLTPDTVVALVPSPWFDESRRARLARFNIELVEDVNGQSPADVYNWWLFGDDQWIHGNAGNRVGFMAERAEEVLFGPWRDSGPSDSVVFNFQLEEF